MRGSSAIQADIDAINAKIKLLEIELEKAKSLLQMLNKIKNDSNNCVLNLKNVYNQLEIGLVDNGKVIGGDNINERKAKLEKFEITTSSAIDKINKRINDINNEIASLKARLSALYAELAEAKAREWAALVASWKTTNVKTF